MIDPTDIRDGHSFLANFKQLNARVVIHNRSPFAAHNPACRVELEGLAGIQDTKDAWIPVTYPRSGRDPASSGMGELTTSSYTVTGTGYLSLTCGAWST
jgi:hypothetical protein